MTRQAYEAARAARIEAERIRNEIDAHATRKFTAEGAAISGLAAAVITLADVCAEQEKALAALGVHPALV